MTTYIFASFHQSRKILIRIQQMLFMSKTVLLHGMQVLAIIIKVNVKSISRMSFDKASAQWPPPNDVQPVLITGLFNVKKICIALLAKEKNQRRRISSEKKYLLPLSFNVPFRWLADLKTMLQQVHYLLVMLYKRLLLTGTDHTTLVLCRIFYHAPV